jgi:HAD superfamily hydrolase (TIGR01549 family)
LLKKAWFKPSAYQHVLGRRLMEELGVKTGKAVLLEELYGWLIGFRPERVMVPGARALLVELKKRGYRMGIISNNDGRTREKCAAVEIEDYFEFILDSTLEGMVKPDPRFFKKALKISGVKPGAALHIGDLWGSDILGARKSGWWAMWVANRHFRPGPKGKVFVATEIKQALKFLE